MPLVLYEDGNVEILQDTGSNIEITNCGFDIAVDNNIIYILEYNKVRRIINPTESNINYEETTNLAFLGEDEVAIKINKYGMFLTNKGKVYEGSFELKNINKNSETNAPSVKEYVFSNSPYKLFKVNVTKLGDYSYQNSNNEIFYIFRNEKSALNQNTNRYDYWYTFTSNNANVKEDTNIKVTKDESKINENKVQINIEVPEGEYSVKLPNGTELNSSTTFEVTENGVYTFEFTNAEGNTSIRVVHVTNIQSRKETKVPTVKALNGEIILESENEVIKYSIDGKETWNNYTDKLTYSAPIYAKIDNDKYECSIVKITLDENGKLEVVNEESRKINGEILTNSLGPNAADIGAGIIFDEGKKTINISQQAAEVIANSEAEDEHSILTQISKIADSIIYSFSSTDSKYAGCYFDKIDTTEMLYKDIEGDINSTESNSSIKGIATNIENKNIDYVIIRDNYVGISNTIYNDFIESGEEITDEKLDELAASSEHEDVIVKKQEKSYVYLDNTGNVYSNIDIIEKAKEQIGTNNFVKIVGDGLTFYILTKYGEVYEITCANNGTYGYFYKKLNKNSETYNGYDIRLVDVIYKLEVKDIVDIYDNCTAKTKDGNIISLIECNEQTSQSIVEELEQENEKYLMASHLALNNSKLYYYQAVTEDSQVNSFDRDAKEVKAGKVVPIDDKDKAVGILSKKENTITLFSKYESGRIEKPDLDAENEECYIIIEEDTSKELPKFIDIAEYRDSYLTNMQYYDNRYNKYLVQYCLADKYAKAIAISEDGEVYAYLSDDNGYVIDPSDFKSLGKSTPFEGKMVYGKCVMTVFGDNVVFKN